jgi:hypothetical protein
MVERRSSLANKDATPSQTSTAKLQLCHTDEDEILQTQRRCKRRRVLKEEEECAKHGLKPLASAGTTRHCRGPCIIVAPKVRIIGPCMQTVAGRESNDSGARWKASETQGLRGRRIARPGTMLTLGGHRLAMSRPLSLAGIV